MIVEIQLRNNENFSEHIAMLMAIYKEFNIGNSVRIIPPPNNFIPYLSLATLASLLNNINNPEDLDLSLINGGYINSLKFPNGLDINSLNSTQLNDLVSSYIGKNYQPIVKINFLNTSNTSTSELFISTIQGQLIQAQLSRLVIPISLYQSISFILGELIDNVKTHSQSQCCNISYQFYPNLKFLDLIIADNGQGLLGSFQNSSRRSFPEITNHLLAIEAALNQYSSKDNEVGRGFGLASSRKIITEGLGDTIKGSFFLLSGDSYFFKNGLERPIASKANWFWKGTFISFRIPVTIPSSFNFYNYME